MQHISLASMGADMADINNDGHPEIFTTDMLPDDDYRLKTTSSFDNIDQFRLREIPISITSTCRIHCS
jgi:hypothetical protein